MSRKTWVLAGIGCLAVILLACVGAALVYFFAGDRVKREVKHLTTATARPSRKTGDICGSYQLVSESGGGKPAVKARIVLKFTPPGSLNLRATRPGETLTDSGTFNISGQSIKLVLPETGKQAEGKFSLDGEKLVLPFQMIGDAPGTSVWRRVETGPDPLRDAVQGFYARAARDGREAAMKAMVTQLQANPSVSSAEVCGAATVLVTYKGGYQEFFLAPPLYPERTRSGGGSSPQSALWRPDALGRGEAVIQRAQFLPQGLGGGLGPPSVGDNSAEAAWLNCEPEPVSKGDAPMDRTALILGAFHTLPVLLPGSSCDHYLTFKEKGENLDQLKQYLEDANYRVDGPHLDSAVTVKLLVDKLRNARWGVLFFSTHGGILRNDAILSTGEEVPVPFSITPQTRQDFLDRYFNDYLDRSVGASLGQAEYRRLRSGIMVGFMYDDIPFVAVKSSFFTALGADFSASLVYLSACESAATGYFRDAMKPRSLAGWITEVDMALSADMNKQFFRCLCRKTRSDREAMTFAIKDCWGIRGWQRIHDTCNSIDRPRMDAHNFAVFRRGAAQSEQIFTVNQFMMIHACRTWVCQRKGGQGLEDTVNALYQYEHGNKAKETEFFLQAFNRVDVPQWQIDQVKGELCGYGGNPTRFTLEEK